MTASLHAQSTTALHASFLAMVPCIERHGRVFFRDLQDAERREEPIAEMVAICWRWFLSLIEHGKDGTRFPSVLATFAARAVRSGRRLCGQERARDVLSPLAQRRGGFTVRPLPDFSALNGNPLVEALQDSVRSDVPSQGLLQGRIPALAVQPQRPRPTPHQRPDCRRAHRRRGPQERHERGPRIPVAA